MEKGLENNGAERAAKGKLLGSMLIFGTIGIVVRQIPLPSSVIALFRGVIGTLFLLLLVRIKHTGLSLHDIRANALKLGLSGIFLGANWILLFEAYRYTTVAIATLCYYLAPVFVMLAAPLVLRERLTPVRALCILGALTGMVFVSGVWHRGGAAGGSPAGILFGVGAAVLYAAIVLINKRLRSISAFDTTVVQLAVSALVLLPYTLLTVRPEEWAFAPGTVFFLAIAGVLHTGVAYALYFGSLKSLTAQTAAIFSYVDPVFAILLSALLLRERLDAAGIVGAVLVLGSTLAAEVFEGRKQNPSPEREAPETEPVEKAESAR